MDEVEVISADGQRRRLGGTGEPVASSDTTLYLVFGPYSHWGLDCISWNLEDADTAARGIAGVVVALPALRDYRLEVKG